MNQKNIKVGQLASILFYCFCLCPMYESNTYCLWSKTLSSNSIYIRIEVRVLYRRMHTMGEEIKMFVGLGWEKNIRSLGDPDVPFILSPECDIRAGNQCSDDYKLTSFSQSTQARRWRMQEEQK